jgi:hypothetical protein
MPEPQGRQESAPLQVDAVLEAVLLSARRLFEGEGGSIMLLVGPEELEVVASPDNPAALGARVRFGEGIAGRVAEACDAALITGRDDSRSKPADSGMSVPLLHDGKIFGVLNINAAKGKTFTDSDLVAATEFSMHAADALAAARLYEAERRRGAERPEQHLESMLEHLRVAAEVDFVGPIELSSVDLMAIARSLAELEDKAGRPTGVRGPATALVMGDGRLLRRVLRELIDNGHRHGEAPVRMIFEKESEDHIVLSVSDSGQGVPVKDRPKVFEPYGRVDGGDDSGLGLGLSMARRLVEHMGGSLSVIDTPVGGASFRMRLAAA